MKSLSNENKRMTKENVIANLAGARYDKESLDKLFQQLEI